MTIFGHALTGFDFAVIVALLATNFTFYRICRELRNDLVALQYRVGQLEGRSR